MAAGFVIILVLILALILAMGNGTFCEGAGTKHPAFFVLGDSLVDIGNNNYLATSARADSPPYGLDYPTHRPTGRFSNGLNIPDIISEEMGWEPILPYLSPELTGNKLLLGANFASAGVGILNDTGIQFVNIIRVPQQLDYFEQYKERVKALIGEEETNKILKEALVLVTLGGNDFVNNYFLLPISARATQFALTAFVPFLISEYKKVLMRLYEIGVGKVLVTGLGPIGCAPAEMATRSINGECAEDLQLASSLFDSHLVQMLDALNKDLSTHVFIGANTNSINLEFITKPEGFGFTTAKMACCGQGPYNGLGLCTPVSNLCPNRDEYVFWDAYHPSEKANRLIVKQILKGSSKYMHPMNLSTFMALETQKTMT